MKNLVFVSFIVSLFYYGNSSEPMDKHLVGRFSSEDRLSEPPCLCEKKNPPLKGLHSSLIIGRNSNVSPRLASIDARERKERLDESMARFMQMMTFLGHVDNFLTQKTSGFLKIVGKAVETDDDEEYEPHYRPTKRTAPRITTTISS